MIVFAGMLAFVSAIWLGTQNLRDGVTEQSLKIQDEAAFGRVAWAVKAAGFSLDGFSMAQPIRLASNASVSWNAEALSWRALDAERLLSATFSSPGRVDLAAGGHTLSVRKDGGVWLAWS